MLIVKRLDPSAIIPTVAHTGEDIDADLYSIEDCVLEPGSVHAIRTGIAIQFVDPVRGAIVKTRSSYAKRGVTVLGGEIDAGYIGEIMVFLSNLGSQNFSISKGDRIAQFRPTQVWVDFINEERTLEETHRGTAGFGSTGK